jgi:hypothetical protein
MVSTRRPAVRRDIPSTTARAANDTQPVESLAEYVRHLVDSWPPFTPQQRDSLRDLFGPVPPVMAQRGQRIEPPRTASV